MAGTRFGVIKVAPLQEMGRMVTSRDLDLFGY